MMTPEENDLLCRVEGDAPMGQIMRRHWIPACMSEEVAEPDGAPVRVRLLGEDLVVFRDSKGRVGVLDEYCPHRRASLAFGRNEECGLRCLYHGWKFDVDGNVVEMASEPAGSGSPDASSTNAYPAREAGGFVWVYMGPPETMREFEPPALAPTPNARVSIVKVHVACNWAQVLEGPDQFGAFVQPAFVRHGAGARRWRQGDRVELAASLDRQGAALPGAAHQLRLPLCRDPPPDHECGDARLHPHHGLHRAVHRADPAQQRAQCRDDADAGTTITTRCSISSPGTAPDKPASSGGLAQVQRAANGASTSTGTSTASAQRDNLYLQDRAAMKAGNFTGINGIPNQDIAMWEWHGRRSATAPRSVSAPATSRWRRSAA